MAAPITCKQCSAEVGRRENTCPNCGAILRQTLPPQTTGQLDVFALPAGVVLGLFAAVILSGIPGDGGEPLLRVGLGVLGLLLPSAIALAWTNRRRDP
jgi:hypothetical protein